MTPYPVYLGVDVGSVSLNIAALDDQAKILGKVYDRTQGQPLAALTRGLRQVAALLPPAARVCGVGVTGSGRRLAGVVLGADVVKNEITAHALASSYLVPSVRTVIEIGGQDSKIIILHDGVVIDFAMNTVCAAGTGSFLDQQAGRLGIPIEQFGELALESRNPARIAGRCTVFAESDMIHKQQIGQPLPDIIAGLCEALVRNYLNNVGRGKKLTPDIVFQGGVAANRGIRRSFERALGSPVIVPEHFEVMGAIGAGLLVLEQPPRATNFRGFAVDLTAFQPTASECEGCSNACELVTIRHNGEVVAVWGDRCGRFSGTPLADRSMTVCLDSVCGKF